ncbi:MAG: hypothetical protein WAK55_08735 [Xanthobacteraceae bacterium]
MLTEKEWRWTGIIALIVAVLVLVSGIGAPYRAGATVVVIGVGLWIVWQIFRKSGWHY